jgi:hypothetical protein
MAAEARTRRRRTSGGIVEDFGFSLFIGQLK